MLHIFVASAVTASVIRMNGATLQAACTDTAASVRLFSPISISSVASDTAVIAMLDGVAESCVATQSIQTPCANHSTEYPALFGCYWQNTAGATYEVPELYAQATEELSGSGRYLGTRITLACPVPPASWLSSDANVTVHVQHLGIDLPWRGIGATGNAIDFAFLSPPANPPPLPPPLPPAPPSLPPPSCGETAQAPLTGPGALQPTCQAGLAWFQVSSYNNGQPFQAYIDKSIDSEWILVFHHMRYVGEVRTPFPTANAASSGTSGWGNSFRLANVATLLASMCPASSAGSARFYIGQHNADGSDLASAGQSQWIAFTDKHGSTFADMFDSTPSTSQFTGTGMRRGDGTTNGPYKYQSAHGSAGGVHQMSTAGGSNAGVLFEWSLTGGADPNHGWTVWSNGLGQYYNANRPGSTTRFGWMGLAGC